MNTTGRPSSQPGRSQPSGGVAGGLEQADRVVGRGWRGERPEPDPSAEREQARDDDRARDRARSPRSNGVTASDPSVMAVSSLPAASATKNTTVPSTTGAPTANRHSSSVQAIGWTTATTTASRVSAIMISRNVRLPKPGSGWPSTTGTLMAM